jgi:tetratricopeptide (TPR) repeat protein
MNDYAYIDVAAYNRMLELIDRATARDPNFAVAYCFATEVNALLYRYRERTPERLKKARDSAAMALQLAPDLGESHLAQALYYYHCLRDYYGAERELETARPTLSGRADYLLVKQMTERRFGHWQAAINDGEKALSLDPRNPVMASVLIQTYILLRMYQQAEQVADDIIARVPPEKAGSMWNYKATIDLATASLKKARETVNAAPVKAQWKDWMLATIAYYEHDYDGAAQLLARLPDNRRDPNDLVLEAYVHRQLGHDDKVEAALGRAKQLLNDQIRANPDEPNLHSSLATALALSGEKEDAFAEINRAAALAPPSQDAIESTNWLNALAEVHLITGDTDAAIEALRKAVDLPAGPSYGELRLNPAWDAIRNQPRFQTILAQSTTPPVYN